MPTLTPDERSQLIVDHMSLACYWANKFRRPGIQVEDLEQSAYLGLCIASRRYDPALGEFAPYATGWVKNQLLEEIRRRHAVTMGLRAIRKDQPWPSRVTMPDLPTKDDDHAARAERADELAAVLATLSPPEREVTVLYYGLGTARPLESREIAARMGICRSMVNRYRKRARAALAEVLSRDRAS